jgi:Xaa-Pro aminopeptidase
VPFKLECLQNLIFIPDDAETLKKTLQPIGSTLVSIKENLIDHVWGGDRPKRPTNRAFPLDIHFSGMLFRPIPLEHSGDAHILKGRTHNEKLTDLRAELSKSKASAFVVNMLDEVAWLFNLRGSDVEYNPVFFAYAIVTHDSATLFVDPAQVDDATRAHLGNSVKLEPYTSFFGALKTLGGGTSTESVRLRCACHNNPISQK